MSDQISLREVERKAFTTIYQDGLVDILIGGFTLMFALAPLLSERLGDFWSSAVFVPFWLMLFAGAYWLRRSVVRPRLGAVKFGPARQRRLRTFLIVMVVVEAMSLGLGLLAATRANPWPRVAVPIIFSLALLAFVSVCAYALDYTRLYGYGLLLAAAPLVGEWLYANMGATHHGYPITFGATSAIIILSGVIHFARFLHRYPLPAEEA
jgi:hypothetical protein